MVFVELKISGCADDRGFILVYFLLYCLGGGGGGFFWVYLGFDFKNGSNPQLPKKI
jgi:hypothetical protein